jgi:hypothetical protein
MRRILLVLTVAALMAAMMVSAGPAKANETNFQSGIHAVQTGDSFIASGDDDFGDNDFGDGVLIGFGDIDIGDDDEDFGDGDIDDEAFLACFPCNFDEFDPGDVDINV